MVDSALRYGVCHPTALCPTLVPQGINMPTLLYLHGFSSSPRSTKAEQMRQYLAEHRPDIRFICPQLAATPAAAWEQIAAIADAIEGKFGVVGSSLGGFFATRVAELYGC